MLMGRLVQFFLPTHSLFSIPAPTLALAFVSLDFVAFVIQIVGGSYAGPTAPAAKQLQGIHIYMGGIGLQLFFICIFVGLVVKFQREMTHLQRFELPSKGDWQSLVWCLYITLGLIAV